MASSAGRPAPEPRDHGATWPVLVAVGLTLVLLPLDPGLRTLLHLRSLVPFWELSRAGGLLAYLCLWLAVLSGVVVHLRLPLPGWLQPLVLDLHQWGAVWAAWVGLFHALLLRFDQYVGFTWTELLVPFTSHYQRTLLGIGTLALYGLVVVLLSTYLRAFLSSRAWRWLHLLSYPGYLLGLWHGIAAGTDTAVPWVSALYAGSAALLFLPLVFRLGRALFPFTRSN